MVSSPPPRYRASPGYVNRQPYLREAAPPDKRCLSYTRPARLWRRVGEDWTREE